jgi:signal transduction histidine kinase
MRWFRHLSIFYKFNAIIVGMLLINIVVGFLATQTALELVEAQLEKRGAELAAYVGVLSSNDILLDDRYALYDRINKTRKNTDDVRYIIISDSAGGILAHTFHDGFPQGLQVYVPGTRYGASDTSVKSENSFYQVTKYESNEGRIREIIAPIENGAIGYVRVGLSEKATEQMMDKRMKEVALIIFLVCMIGAGGATYQAFVVIHPLRRLTQAAGQIRHGNFQVHAEVAAQDEVGKLATVFNEMAGSLQYKQEENDRLLEELRTKEMMRAELIRKLFTVQEEERKRISRELHDETGQLLASLLTYIKLLLSKVTDENQKNLLQSARDVAIDALGGLRRIAVELRPPVLDDLGLAAAMNKYMQNFSKQQGTNVHFTVPEGKLELGGEVSLALYRILQESLTNIAKHAEATNVYVSLIVAGRYIKLIIQDDGIGIDTDLDASYRNSHLGIYGMAERAELLGGSFELDSGLGGTTISITLLTHLR